VDPNVFETANAGFAQAMYEEFLKDPSAVGPEWRRLFESGVVGEGNGAGQRGSGEAGKQVGGQPAAATADQPRPTQPPRLPTSPPAAGLSPIKGPAAKLVANMTESLTVPTATTFRELTVAVLE
jgi:2-oxoglutarate decarboxylase